MGYLVKTLMPYAWLLTVGLGKTIMIWLITTMGSLIVGSLFGLLTSSRVASRNLRFCVRLYAFIARGIPAYVQILIAYFVIPALFGLHGSALVSACGALIFCSSGYVIEIIRSGLRSIPEGQWDAAYVLGYSSYATIQRIILPQLIRVVLPTLISESEQLLKSSTLCATIGIVELTRTGMNIISRELNPIPVYLAIAVIYLMLSACLQLLLWYVDRKVHYGTR